MDGLTEGVLKENAEGAEGVSEGGLGAKEKPEDPEPKGAFAPRENAEGAELTPVDDMEKEKPDVDDDDNEGAVGTMLKGAADEEAAGGGGVKAATGVRERFGNAGGGADEMVATVLGGWVAKEPGLGSLSPSKARVVGGEISCFTPAM